MLQLRLKLFQFSVSERNLAAFNSAEKGRLQSLVALNPLL